MAVDPDPRELCGLPAERHLIFEKIRHGLIIEGHGDGTGALLYGLDIFDQEQVVSTGNAEATDLCVPTIPQELEFGPGISGESKARCFGAGVTGAWLRPRVGVAGGNGCFRRW